MILERLNQFISQFITQPSQEVRSPVALSQSSFPTRTDLS